MLAFVRALFLNPRSIGAIVPSSDYLAEAMAQYIDKTQSGFVLELGPGTGVITQGILKAGVPARKIISLELANFFAKKLRERFPDITVIEGNATELSDRVKDHLPIDTIVSSLPLKSLSKKDREKILIEISKVLSPGGHFIQFTYMIYKEPKKYYPSNFVLEKSSIVWRNIPPARIQVFRIEKN